MAALRAPAHRRAADARGDLRAGPPPAVALIAAGSGSRPPCVRHIALTPCVEHQEGPQNLPVIPPTVHVLADELTHCAGIEEADMRHPLGGKTCLQHLAQRAAEPRPDRDAEPLLATVEDRRGE